MKKQVLFLLALMATVCLSANAQHFKNSRYYNPRSGSLDYSHHGPSYGGNGYGRTTNYFGLRVGLTATDINTDCQRYDNGSAKAGLDAGIVAGFGLSRYTPLFLETGVEYVEKGGKYNYGDTKCSLNYLEMPIVVKYAYTPNGRFAVEPYAGGYLAMGISGKEKYRSNYGGITSSTDSFGDNGSFQRFDGGIKVGCGFSFDALYAEVGYEYGLSDINKDNRADAFDEIHNSAFTVKVGVNF